MVMFADRLIMMQLMRFFHLYTLTASVREVRKAQLILFRFRQILVLMLKFLKRNPQSVHVIDLLLLPLLLDDLFDLRLGLFLLGPALIDFIDNQFFKLVGDAG